MMFNIKNPYCAIALHAILPMSDGKHRKNNIISKKKQVPYGLFRISSARRVVNIIAHIEVIIYSS